MGVHVAADPHTRIIDVVIAPTNGLLTLDVALEIYSELKDDWRTTPSLQGLRFPLEPLGGDATIGNEAVGRSVFVRNQDGWRFRPYDIDHELSLIGNLYPRDASLPLRLSRPGRTIAIALDRSALALELRTDGGADPEDVAAAVWAEMLGSRSAAERLRLVCQALVGRVDVSGPLGILFDEDSATELARFLIAASGRTPQ